MIIRNKNLHENILETGIVQKKQPKFFWILTKIDQIIILENSSITYFIDYLYFT